MGTRAKQIRVSHKPEEMLPRLGFPVRSFHPIKWKEYQSTPLYVVDAGNERFVLKCRSPSTAFNSRVRRLLGSPELAAQARVYSSLMRQSFRYFNFPRLIDTDGRTYLLLEYIPTHAHSEADVPRDALLDSLLEFQFAEIAQSHGPLQTLLATKSTPFARLMRRLLTSIRSKLGWRIAQSSVEKALQLYRMQARIPTINCHNDFHYSNLLISPSGALYVTDFETVTLEDRWILSDIIHLAARKNEFFIDTDLIADYFDRLMQTRDLRLNFAAQVRFGLLLRVSRHIISPVPPQSAVSKYASFFREVLLNDDAFDRWMTANFDGK